MALVMMRLGDAVTELAAQMTALGVRVCLDTSRTELPCALIFPAEVLPDRLDGMSYTAVWDVYVVSGDHGVAQAYNDLGGMLAKLAPSFGIERATPATLSLASHQNAELPALQFQVVTEITPDED